MGYKLTWMYVWSQKVRPTWYRSSWDITTAVQDQSIQPQSISNNRNITVSSDGYHILLVNETLPIYEYTLSTPRDLTSTITIKTKSFTSLGSAGYCSAVVYSEDGNYLYVHFWEQYWQSCVIAQYQLNTPFDITTAWNAIASKMITWAYDIGWFRFYDNWTKIIWDLRDNSNIFTWELWTAWDITTLSNLVKQWNKGYTQWFAISSDGKNCYMTDEYHSNMTQLTTTTPYNFTTSTSKTRARPWTYSYGIDVTADGKYLFVARKNGYIYRYAFTELS